MSSFVKIAAISCLFNFIELNTAAIILKGCNISGDPCQMFENKMTQAKLAGELGVGKSKVSEILSGKRKPDVIFLKGIYKILKIDADFLLEHA